MGSSGPLAPLKGERMAASSLRPGSQTEASDWLPAPLGLCCITWAQRGDCGGETADGLIAAFQYMLMAN